MFGQYYTPIFHIEEYLFGEDNCCEEYLNEIFIEKED